MEKEVVYVAELDSDVDDVVAAHYLFNEGVLKCVVCDPYPRTPEGLARKGKLEALGIDVVKKMPPVAKYVFVGGALTAVAGYIRMHHVDWLVILRPLNWISSRGRTLSVPSISTAMLWLQIRF